LARYLQDWSRIERQERRRHEGLVFCSTERPLRDCGKALERGIAAGTREPRFEPANDHQLLQAPIRSVSVRIPVESWHLS